MGHSVVKKKFATLHTQWERKFWWLYVIATGKAYKLPAKRIWTKKI